MKDPTARSLVAGVNAMFRALEHTRAAPLRIVDDPFAHRFAERDPRVLGLRALRHVLPSLRRLVDELQTAHCVRHRAIDALVLRALRSGAEQVVIVGAGYDMRAQRLHADHPSARWFEVDHPATQARKLALLKGDPLDRQVPVARVAAKLLHDDLRAHLARVGFVEGAPTCFVLEGLVHYLPPARCEALFAALHHRAAPRAVILSYIHSDIYARASSAFIRVVRLLREVPRWHTTPSALAALAAQTGFERCHTWTHAAQIEHFAAPARSRPAPLSQDVAVFENAAQRPLVPDATNAYAPDGRTSTIRVSGREGAGELESIA